MTAMNLVDRRLAETRQAFDRVAHDYDGPSGNNEIVKIMRAELWQEVCLRTGAPARLLDLGCGTGLDAAYFAERGYDVVATDWSPAMVERSRGRFHDRGLESLARAEVLGVQELARLTEDGFDCVYSDLGALNCVPDLNRAAPECARVLRSGGCLVFSVIGRSCPWESAYFAVRRDPANARRRSSTDPVPVGLSGETVWTSYYTPAEFYQPFSEHFELTSYRSLALFLPPPYLVGLYRHLGPIGPFLNRLDGTFGRLPRLRDLGDHFLMVMTKRYQSAEGP